MDEPVQDAIIRRDVQVELSATTIRELIEVVNGGVDRQITSIPIGQPFVMEKNKDNAIGFSIEVPKSDDGILLIEKDKEYYWSYFIIFHMPNGRERTVTVRTNIFKGL